MARDTSEPQKEDISEGGTVSAKIEAAQLGILVGTAQYRAFLKRRRRRAQKQHGVSSTGAPVFARNDKGIPVCGAQAASKDPGGICMSMSLNSTGRCNKHGGKSRKGPTHPNFMHGKHSGVLPTTLASDYDRLRKDKQLSSLRDNIALLYVRQRDILSSISAGMGDVRTRLLETAAAMESWIHTTPVARDTDTIESLIHQVSDTVNSGGHDDKLWKEVYGLDDAIRRNSEAENKRLAQERQTVTSDQAMVLISALIQIVKENVHERSVRANIAYAISKLISAPAPVVMRQLGAGTDHSNGDGDTGDTDSDIRDNQSGVADVIIDVEPVLVKGEEEEMAT